MKNLIRFSFLLAFIHFTSCTEPTNEFAPTIESLQNYETPEWFRDAKFGIWVCWNAYTVPAVGDWYARNMYIEGHPHYKFHVENYGHPSEFGYKDIIRLWKGENFDAQELVDLFVDMGARYIVAMANHHDNFDLWDSEHHSWNSVNYGPGRDIIGEFMEAVMAYEDQGIRWGVTSHVERASCWFQTNKGADKQGPYAGVPYDGNDERYQELYLPPDPAGDMKPTQPSNAPLWWRENWLARCKDLFEKYDPDFFYVDGGVPFPGEDDAQTGLKMIAHLYNQNAAIHGGENEAVMAIKNWSKKMPQHEWGFYEEGIATLNIERRRLPVIRKKPWQTDTSIGDWTYVEGGEYRSASEILHELIDIVSKNGNMLLNVSPKPDGTLDQEALELLEEIGAWMKMNGESIYGTRPWVVSGDGDQRIVKKGKDLLYLTLMAAPDKPQVEVPYLAPAEGKSLGISSVYVLSQEDKTVNWTSDESGLHLELPKNLEYKHAMVFKIEGTGLENYDETAALSIMDRREELALWWNSQKLTETGEAYLAVSCDNQNRVWAIKSDHSLVELVDGEEHPVGVKAQDVGSSSAGIVYVGLDGGVYLHASHDLMWVELPEPENQITHTGEDGRPWLLLPGIEAKRCDISNTGTVWVTDRENTVSYYNDTIWKALDKKAEDIACGGDWVGSVAAISGGQLHRFEGLTWTNMGGADLIALDISLQEDVIVTLDRTGTITVHDVLGSAVVQKGDPEFADVSCGLKNGDEAVVLAKSE